MAPTVSQGFLAQPPAGTGRPVLLLHAWWGLNDTIRGMCKRLANEGFVAFAPDLYDGQVANTIAGAEALANALDHDKARAVIRSALDYVSDRAGGAEAGIAVIGFSLGAFFALDVSMTAPERIAKVVTFYGTRPGGDFRKARAAYLGHYAKDDEYEPLDDVAAVEAAIRRAGRPVTFHIYDGTGHWFCEPDRNDAYNETAATLAWERTLAFLHGA